MEGVATNLTLFSRLWRPSRTVWQWCSWCKGRRLTDAPRGPGPRPKRWYWTTPSRQGSNPIPFQAARRPSPRCSPLWYQTQTWARLSRSPRQAGNHRDGILKQENGHYPLIQTNLIYYFQEQHTFIYKQILFIITFSKFKVWKYFTCTSHDIFCNTFPSRNILESILHNFSKSFKYIFYMHFAWYFLQYISLRNILESILHNFSKSLSTSLTCTSHDIFCNTFP